MIYLLSVALTKQILWIITEIFLRDAESNIEVAHGFC